MASSASVKDAMARQAEMGGSRGVLPGSGSDEVFRIAWLGESSISAAGYGRGLLRRAAWFGSGSQAFLFCPEEGPVQFQY